MERARLIASVVCLLISYAEPQPFSVLVYKTEVNATVGDTAILPVRPSSPVSSGFWKFDGESIVLWTVEPPNLNVAYTKRNVLLLDNTSLLLYSVALKDTGDYWVTMDSPTGQEAKAKVTLNVFQKSAPFTISVKSSKINVVAGDTVILSVSPSEEVKNGSWMFGGNVVAWWRDTFPEISPDYTGRAAISSKTSLKLKSVSALDTGEYDVTMSTASGNTRTAKVELNVYDKPQPLSVSPVLSSINAEAGASVILSVRISGEVKNGTWSANGYTLFQWNGTNQNMSQHKFHDMDLLPNASLLLTSVYTYGFSEFTITLESPSGSKASANITLQVFNLLTIFCKGYRAGLTLMMTLAFCFIIAFSIVINKHWCSPRSRPALDFIAE
ncbi:uncharacterized protein LOC125448563 isoform X2 [Stegostoma tigrinum]|uniref:uncharacterized protein LOC125448563 isoform X2 n=1 Tax=Stegostoma tigrinum TaxID=3053191 RepID=UPI00286FF1EB|nr:uncharacterized protein LOC125448563 isoform X2 [Stegostoma tigrinum]